MERRHNTWKIVCAVLLVIAFLPLVPVVGCVACVCADPEGTMGRYSPYSQEQVLEILEIEYDMEFIVTDCSDKRSYIEYTVYPTDLPELTFSFYDYCDGFGGWYADDNFGSAVLRYCAQKNGIEVSGDDYPVLLIADYDADDLALRLELTFDRYFEIFTYCKGNIRKYSSYHPQYKGCAVDFSIERYSSERYHLAPKCTLYAWKYEGFYNNPMLFKKGMDRDKIKAIIAPLF